MKNSFFIGLFLLVTACAVDQEKIEFKELNFFLQLPQELQKKTVVTIATDCGTLEDGFTTINNLACVNKAFYKLVNDVSVTKAIIEYTKLKTNNGDLYCNAALATRTAKNFVESFVSSNDGKKQARKLRSTLVKLNDELNNEKYCTASLMNVIVCAVLIKQKVDNSWLGAIGFAEKYIKSDKIFYKLAKALLNTYATKDELNREEDILFDGKTCLAYAASATKSAPFLFLKLLLQHPDVDVNKPIGRSKLTPLMEAVFAHSWYINNCDRIKLLLDHSQIDVSKLSINNQTALDIALELDKFQKMHDFNSPYKEVIKLLTENSKKNENMKK